MKLKTIFSVATLTIAASFYAQEGKTTSAVDNLYPSLVEFSETNAPAFIKGQFHNLIQGKQSQNPEAKFIKSERDHLGYEHFRYQQTLNNIPIEGTFIIQHVKNGKLTAQNGVMVKNFTQEVTNSKSASVSEKAALEIAKNFVGAKQFKWEIA